MNNFTIMDAREMTKSELDRTLNKCREELEKLGMNHREACRFVNNIMNLGIAIQEKSK